MSCFCDIDPAEVFRQRWVTARKEHRCEECGAAIHPGDRYHRVFWISRGDVGEVKECARCAALIVELQADCSMTVHGNVLFDLLEDFGAEDFAIVDPELAGHVGGLFFAQSERGYDHTQRWMVDHRAKQREEA